MTSQFILQAIGSDGKAAQGTSGMTDAQVLAAELRIQAERRALGITDAELFDVQDPVQHKRYLNMYNQCIFNVFSMYYQCIFNVFSMYYQCIINVISMYLQCIFAKITLTDTI